MSKAGEGIGWDGVRVREVRLDPRWNRNKKCAKESNAARLPPTAPRVGQRAPFAHMCRDPTPTAHVDLAPATTTSRSVVSGPIGLVRAFNIVVGKMPCARANAARCAALRVVVPSDHLRRARPVETFSTRGPQRRVNDRRADLVFVVVCGVLRVVNVRVRAAVTMCMLMTVALRRGALVLGRVTGRGGVFHVCAAAATLVWLCYRERRVIECTKTLSVERVVALVPVVQ